MANQGCLHIKCMRIQYKDLVLPCLIVSIMLVDASTDRSAYSVTRACRHLPKNFDNVHNLEFRKDAEGNPTKQAIGMYSGDCLLWCHYKHETSASCRQYWALAARRFCSCYHQALLYKLGRACIKSHVHHPVLHP